MPVTFKSLLVKDSHVPSPQRWPEAAMLETKAAVTARTWNALYMQDPVDEGGGTLREEWWQRYTSPPQHVRRTIISVDSAWKTGVQHDYSVLALWAKTTDGHYWLLDVLRARWEFPELMLNIHRFYERHRHLTPGVLVEDAASGQGVIPNLRRPFIYTLPGAGDLRFPSLPVVAHKVKSSRSKELRVDAVTPLIQGGLVHVPRDAPWLNDWLHEHNRFPAGEHDDQVDTTSMALEHLAGVNVEGLPASTALVEEWDAFEPARPGSKHFAALKRREEDDELRDWIKRGVLSEGDLTPG